MAGLALLTLAVATISVLAFAGQRVGPEPVADYTPPAVPVRLVPPTVVFIGDSFTGGSDMGGRGDANWTDIASMELNWSDCSSGIGGSGWTVGINGWTYGARIDWALRQNPSLIVFSNGINDLRGEADSIGPAATDALSYLREKDPDVPVVVVGPIPMRDFSTLHIMNDGLRVAAETNGAVYIDAIERGWFTQEAARYIGSDSFHPTDEGHQYLAKEFALSVREAGVELLDMPRTDRVRCLPPNASSSHPDGTPVEP